MLSTNQIIPIMIYPMIYRSNHISDNIKAALPMRRAVEFYGFKPNRSGYICCPFHSEKTPSLKIYPDGWWCFGCNSGGDVIDFVGRVMNLNYLDSCKQINSDFSLGLEIGGKRNCAAERKARDKLRLEQIQRQEFAKWQTKTSRLLCEYHRVLYKFIQSGGTDNPQFFTALQNIGRVEYLIDELEREPNEFYRTCRKEVEEIRKSLTGLKS